MRLLLDTHVLLWLWLEPERLRQDVIDAVTDAYRDFGYELVLLPLVPIPQRIEFVLQAIDQ